MRKLLSLDLSTSCTGYAIFDLDSEELLEYGAIKPKVPLLSKMKYPEGAYHRIVDMSTRILEVIQIHEPEHIIIEEVNRGINRIAQKSLDALHFFVLDILYFIEPEWLKAVVWRDSNGRKGWRGMLGLQLSVADKEYNKTVRAFNKSAKRKKDKLKKQPVIDWKKLAQLWVNANYETHFDVWANAEDADIVDAICVGSSFFLDK